MNQFISSNEYKVSKDNKNKDVDKALKCIDSGVCVESLNSISSILTSSSSLSSNYSKKIKNHEFDENKLLESEDLNELYEYDYDEKEDINELNENINKKTNDYSLIKEKKLINDVYSNFHLQDHDGNTMLHLAILQNKTQLINDIISSFNHPDYLDIRNNWLQTPLHLACLTGQSKVLRRLLISGATINLIDKNGDTPIHLACKTGDLNFVKQFFLPISNAEIFNANLKYKTSINSLSYLNILLNQKNLDGETCVYIAAMSGNLNLINYLVNLGADINSQELKQGNTILHCAVKLKNIDLIKFLIKSCGASVNKTNYARETPLNLAWKMFNNNKTSKRIKIMIHLLKENGGEPLEYYSDSDSYSSSLSSSENFSD